MTAIYLWEVFVNIIENVITAFLLYHRVTLRNSKYSRIIFTCCLPSFMSMFADQITYTIALFVTAKNPNSFDFLGNNFLPPPLIFFCLLM